MEFPREKEPVLAMSGSPLRKRVVVSDSGNNRVQLWAFDGALRS